MFYKDEQTGCRVILHPNHSSVRCGDRVNNVNWNPNEGAIQLCPMCELRRKNSSLIDALNAKHKN
ncbi:hypothetical protein TX36_24210 [Salmonella enterica]|nr:hypothetical protein [Salmonella enterica subsp. enterica serovar Brunei]EAO7511067.1 hypothetical protein [Salmonella enterica]EDT2974241.1 hypothetical protein [Salmonella enterica subsp. enterica]EGZ3992299.1 hypothetical protein [Salmonella enterica subsp. enterica serovar Giza]EAX3122606.1 hypothetical protein [Salmonella enterica]